MLIRKAELSDGDAIWRVHAAAIREICGERYSKAAIEAWAGQLGPGSYAHVIEERELFVAVEETFVIGFGQLNVATGEVEAVYVHPGALRRGVGSKLLVKLEQTALAHGVTELTLSSSLNAVPFYEARGYRHVADHAHRLASGAEIACARMSKVISRTDNETLE